jgi:hypothetical protein
LAGPLFSPGGGIPPSIVPVTLSGSYTGTNGWFVITNGFYTTNQIYLSAMCTNTGVGSVQVYGMDHYELYHRTNSFYQQGWVVGTPSQATDPANKSYVDSAVQLALASQWQSWTTNNRGHYSYNVLGSPLVDYGFGLNFGQLSSVSRDGTGTNLVFSTGVTNLVTGWELLTTTNLLLPFVPVTSGYTTNIAAGLCTFTVPILPIPAQFYAITLGFSATIAHNAPPQEMAGVFYPSNTFNLFTVTNNNFLKEYFWEGYSNHSLITIYVSNGIPTLVNKVH